MRIHNAKNMPRRLVAEDYRKDAVSLAKELLGKRLCKKTGRKVTKLRITETEAYYGEDDTACHAHKGKTVRTSIMYLEGGHAYIYLCYGIHWLLNIVSGKEDFPEAVLIRSLEGFNGPGKLTKAFGIDKKLNGENLAESNQLWVEDSGEKCHFKASKRIGIGYASEKDKNRLWRFTAELTTQHE
jgi:DNA-3-methyladenine glycosylase